MKSNMLTTISASLKKTSGKAEFFVKKNSAEIMLGVGIITFAGALVGACKATLKAEEVLEYHNQKMKDIHEAKEIADGHDDELEYDEQQYKQDLAVQYTKTAVEFVKVYAPVVALASLSLTCILVSRNIMKKRYLGAVAAYNAVSGAFEQYRQRVRDEQGELMDRHYRYGTSIEELTKEEIDENGKKKKVKEQVENLDPSLILPNDTCRFFDESNPNWDRNPSFSMMFLRNMQNYFNDLLHTRGFVMLNEVYKELGFPQTPEGQLLGWVDGLGDSCIDFGLYDQSKESVRRFVNGEENVILLEFNHDGPVWDKIGL